MLGVKALLMQVTVDGGVVAGTAAQDEQQTLAIRIDVAFLDFSGISPASNFVKKSFHPLSIKGKEEGEDREEEEVQEHKRRRKGKQQRGRSSEDGTARR